MIFEQAEQSKKVVNLAELKDKIESKFHKCKLKRKLVHHDFNAEQADKWTCVRNVGDSKKPQATDTKCLQATKQEWNENSQSIPGWECSECHTKMYEVKYVICEKCLTCEVRIQTLIEILADDELKKDLTTIIQLYNDQEKGTSEAYVQAFPNIPSAYDDCELAKRVFHTKYLVKPEDIVPLYDAKKKQCIEAYKQLLNDLKADQTTKYLVIHVLAGHGC